MADLQIEVGIKGGNDIARLAKDIAKIEKQTELLYKTFAKGQLSSEAFRKGLNQQAKSVTELGFSYQGGIKVVNQYVAKLKVASAEEEKLKLIQKGLAQDLKMAADAAEYQNKKLLGISTTYKSASSSASAFSTLLKQQEQDQKDAAVASQRLESEVDQLRLKYDSVYSSSKIYESSLNELNRALKINAISTDIYQKEVDQLNNEFQQFQAGTTNLQNRFVRFNTSMQASGKAARRFQLGIQQAGFQVGDFFTQIASGANPMVAFTQQATQLAGFFAGPWGAAIGAGLSIVGALGVVFMATRDKAEDLKEKLDDVKGAIDNLQGVDDSLEALLSDPITRANTALTGYLQNLRTIKAEVVQAGVAANIGELLGPQVERLKEISSATSRNRRRGEGPERALLEEESASISRLIDRLTTAAAGPAEDLGKRLLKVRQELEASGDLSGTLLRDFDLMLDSTGLRAQAEAQVTEAREATLATGERLAKQDADLVAEAKRRRAEEEAATNAFISGLQAAITYQTKLSEERAKSAKSYDDQVASLETQTKLLNTELMYGKDSLLYREALLQIEKQLFLAKLQTLSLGPAEIENLMQMYEVMLNLKRQLDKPSVTKTTEAPESNLERLRKQLALEQELIGKNEAQKRVLQALGEERNKYSKSTIDGLIKTIELIQTENDKIAQQQAIAQSIESAMESAFMSMVDGTKSVKDAFKDMARAIIADLYKMFVVKQITGFVTGSVSNFMAGPVQGPSLPSSVQANGGAWSGGNIIPFANGGIVGGPTNFPMSGGRTGLMGEAGPEAIMPLKRGPNGKLGVEAQGSGGIVINQSFNFSANGDESVKRIIAKEAPRIAQMTQQQIMDSRRRGGTMKATFG